MSTMFGWLWGDKFKWGLVEQITSKNLSDDPTTVVGSERPALTRFFADWMVNYTQLCHRQTILLPHAGCEPLLTSLKRLTLLDYWLVEQDKQWYDRLLNDETVECGAVHADSFIYDIDCIWNMNFDQWVDSFDAASTQADAVILNAPLNRASSDMVLAWDFLKRHGNMVAIIPKLDLFGKDKANKMLRRWCMQRELTYGIPKLGLFSKATTEPVVVIFGEKTR